MIINNTLMKNTEYNGWTNYATWRINLEIFDDIDTDKYGHEIQDGTSAYDLGQDYLKPYVEELIEMQVTPLRNNLAESYALAFINDVNWTEIAEHIIDTYRENYCCANCNATLEDTSDTYCSKKCMREDNALAVHPKG